jgi:hypothetical protein
MDIRWTKIGRAGARLFLRLDNIFYLTNMIEVSILLLIQLCCFVRLQRRIILEWY